MPGETKNGMQCAEFDALLSEALDEKLTGAKLESFQAHARSVLGLRSALCGSRAGEAWLKSLEEVEPPANLVDNILVATSGLDTLALQGSSATASVFVERYPRLGWRDRARSSAMARQPRFAMSFGMAFFSLSVR